MSDGLLKSYQFRKEREGSWKELEDLVKRIEKKGLKSLSAQELMRLPNLYRFTLSSLSVARGISLDRNLLDYLERLSARAYICVYGVRASFGGNILRFFLEDFPAGVWAARWRLLVAFLVTVLGAVTAFYLMQGNEEWYYTIMPDAFSDGRNPATSTHDLREGLYDGAEQSATDLQLFASYLFTHNASIAMFSFALGFALGVPTLLLLFYNGTILGAFLALYAGRGLGWDVAAWISIHGTTELLAIIIAGAAGLELAHAAITPGEESRLANLARTGRRVSYGVIGTVIMLIVAALLEGFGRQWVNDMGTRFAIGGGMLVLWGLYFTLLGRRAWRRKLA